MKVGDYVILNEYGEQQIKDRTFPFSFRVNINKGDVGYLYKYDDLANLFKARFKNGVVYVDEKCVDVRERPTDETTYI